MTVWQDEHVKLFLLLAASPRHATHVMWPQRRILENSLISLQEMQVRYLRMSCGFIVPGRESGRFVAIRVVFSC